MNENKAVPNIRFKSFENYWVKIKVSNLGNKFTGGGTPSKKNKSYWSGSIPWFQSSDLILNNVLKISIKKRITCKAIDESSTKLVSKDSIAIVTRVGVGKLVLIPYKYTTSQDFISISEIIYNKKFVLYLLYYVLNYSRRLGTKQGTSIKGITKNYFLTTEVVLPKNSFEQQKIGDFFTKLDKLLDLQQQKIDKLELLKKALLQKLFSKHDAKIPELRFKGFEDNWIIYSFSGLLIKNSSKNKNLEVENIESISNKNGFTKQSEQFDGYRVASLDLSNYYVIKGNQFAYNPSRINVGSIAYKRKGEEDSIISPLYVSFSTKNNINDAFLWYWFRTSSFKKQRIQFSEGGVRDTLPFENLKKMRIKLPRLNEQQKIGSLLSKVDQLIELENKKLQNSQQAKKCLLQNMFVE